MLEWLAARYDSSEFIRRSFAWDLTCFGRSSPDPFLKASLLASPRSLADTVGGIQPSALQPIRSRTAQLDGLSIPRAWRETLLILLHPSLMIQMSRTSFHTGRDNLLAVEVPWRIRFFHVGHSLFALAREIGRVE